MLAAYFDLDGTLLDSGPCVVMSTQEAFKKFCDVELTPESILHYMGIPIEVSFRTLSAGKIHDENWDEVATYFRECYRRNSDAHTSLYDGGEALLQDMARKTDNIFIVTSKRSDAAIHNLKMLNAHHYFKEIIGSDNVDHYKPHPDPVYKARALVSPAPLAELVIGDADSDIIMGKAAGAKTCAVTWGAHNRQRLEAAQPDYIAETFAELRDIVNEYL